MASHDTFCFCLLSPWTCHLYCTVCETRGWGLRVCRVPYYQKQHSSSHSGPVLKEFSNHQHSERDGFRGWFCFIFIMPQFIALPLQYPVWRTLFLPDIQSITHSMTHDWAINNMPFCSAELLHYTWDRYIFAKLAFISCMLCLPPLYSALIQGEHCPHVAFDFVSKLRFCIFGESECKRVTTLFWLNKKRGRISLRFLAAEGSAHLSKAL